VNGRELSKYLGKVPADKYPTPLLVRIINQTLMIMYGQPSEGAEEEEDGGVGAVLTVPSTAEADPHPIQDRIEAKTELLAIFKALQTKKVSFKSHMLYNIYKFREYNNTRH